MATASASTDRLLSLDVMRGATIMGMILVNNPGSWGHLYWPLAHKPWHGWTPTDLIFPFFVFMVGVSMAYSFRIRAERQVPCPLQDHPPHGDSHPAWIATQLFGAMVGHSCGERRYFVRHDPAPWRVAADRLAYLEPR
jgi:hypothetical protein